MDRKIEIQTNWQTHTHFLYALAWNENTQKYMLFFSPMASKNQLLQIWIDFFSNLPGASRKKILPTPPILNNLWLLFCKKLKLIRCFEQLFSNTFHVDGDELQTSLMNQIKPGPFWDLHAKAISCPSCRGASQPPDSARAWHAEAWRDH